MAIPVAPSAISQRQCRRIAAACRRQAGPANGRNSAEASTQRSVFSVTGSISSRSARPAMKLPDQNSAATVNATGATHTRLARDISPETLMCSPLFGSRHECGEDGRAGHEAHVPSKSEQRRLCRDISPEAGRNRDQPVRSRAAIRAARVGCPVFDRIADT